MHVPPQPHPIERALAERLPHLRGPQRRGLALWVLGAVLAQGRLPGGGARRPPALGALPRPAPAPARVAPGRGGQGLPPRRAGRRRTLFRALAALGARLVA